MIPICDGRGQVIGFGARALLPDDNPKYLNSPQSPLFDKGRTLFGLNLARRTIRESETAVIVEGYMDVIQAHQAGFQNVVAQMGTALTEPQLRQLSKYARRLILALDADAAGVKATMRGLNVARQTLGDDSALTFDPRGTLRHASKLDVELLVLTVREGKDPDDLIRENPQAWAELVESAQPVVDYVIEVGTAQLSAKSTFGDREAVARDLLPILMATEGDLQQHYNIQRLALKLHLDERMLIQWAQQQQQPGRLIMAKPGKQKSPLKIQQAVEMPPDSTQRTMPQTSAMERYCLSMLIRKPSLWSLANRKLREIAGPKGSPHGALGPLNADDLTHSDFKAIMNLLEQALTQDDLEPLDYMERHLPYELRAEVERLFSEPTAAYRQRRAQQMLERESEQVNEQAIRSNDEFLRRVLHLRKQRIERENKELYFLMQDADGATQIMVLQQSVANKRAIFLIDNAIQEMVESQRILN
jgi:DNA primase